MHNNDSITNGMFAESAPEVLYDRKIVNFIHDLESCLPISRDEMCAVMGLRQTSFRKVLLGQEPLGINEFSLLSRHVGFSLDKFDEGTVDFKALREHWSGNRTYIPERYSIGARSRNTMIINVYNYTRKKYGSALAKCLFKYLQIEESICLYPNEKTNFRLFEDATDYLKSLGLNDLDIYNIGLNTIETNKGSEFAQKMSSFKYPKDMYEVYMGHLIREVEQNNDYKITKLTQNFCEVESHEHEEMLDIFKVKSIGGFNRCLYRVGGLAGATRYMGLPVSHVEETSCVHHGDSVCTFRINFENANRYVH